MTGNHEEFIKTESNYLFLFIKIYNYRLNALTSVSTGCEGAVG